MLGVSDIERARLGLAFWLRRWYRSPLAYVIEHLGETPTHQQAAILKAFEKHCFVAVASGHGIGKTRLESWLAHWWLDTRAKVCPVTGASADQLDNIFWKEAVSTGDRKWKFISRRYDTNTGEIRLKKAPFRSYCVKRTARPEKPDALQGFHDCFFILEEASGILDSVFEVASGAFGDPGNMALMIGNPVRTIGYMARTFKSKDTFWHCLRFSSEDSCKRKEYRYSYVDPYGDVKWISCSGRQEEAWYESMKKEYGEKSNTYRVRVLGEFANEGLDLVVESNWLERVWLEPLHNEAGKKRVMGVDVGYTGEDPSAIVIRQGRNILYAWDGMGLDPVELTNRICLVQSEWKCDAINVDEIGVGAGVYANLKHAGYPVNAVNVSNSPPEISKSKGYTECEKLRDWLWWQARFYYKEHSVRYGGVPGNDAMSRLRDELVAPSYSITPRGLVKVEGKNEMKKRGMRSPNLADAHNMTFYGDNSMFDIFGPPVTFFKKKSKKSYRSWKIS